MKTTRELRRAALAALTLAEPGEKLVAASVLSTALDVDVDSELEASAALPGRPSRPRLVAPRSLAQRSVGTRSGRAALLHALAHIEFNAINLALDAIWRFSGMPRDYYLDWLRVAQEEAEHFKLLQARLASLESAYGDFDAHDGLWEMAEKTRHDVLARMALVPRTLEARGLDASPAIRDKLMRAGDLDSALVIDVILRDEIGHVAIGNRWFREVCRLRGFDPLQTGRDLARRFGAPSLRPPFNFAARRAAGFEAAELDALCNSGGAVDADARRD
jgi:uncharacterized ferritin-like protein (DUF455 family)